MSAMMETKYTTVGVDIDDASAKDNYFGYMSVTFDLDTDEANFFAETFENELLERIQDFFRSVPNVMVDREIRSEDGAILIDLPNTKAKIYATDVHKIVVECERQFQIRAGL